MTKKAKHTEPEHIHELVIFKTKEEKQSKIVDQYSFEEIDQENMVVLKNLFVPFAAHYRYSIILENQSLAPISDVKIKVTYPEFLKLTRSKAIVHLPETVKKEDKKQITIEFAELNEKSNKQIHLHFSPMTLDANGELRTVVSFVNNKDFIRVLTSNPAIVYIDKITIEPKIIPSTFIGEFSKSPGIKKVIKSLGIGAHKKIKIEMCFDILEQILFIRNFQLIAKDANKQILWFFGDELESKAEILIIAQIVLRKVEIIGISQNQHLLISLLTLLTRDFEDRFLFDGIINKRTEVYNLECKYCGAILPNFPKKGKSIECKNCNYEQVIW